MTDFRLSIEEDSAAEQRREPLRQEGIDHPEGAQRNGAGPGQVQSLVERFDPVCAVRSPCGRHEEGSQLEERSTITGMEESHVGQ